MARKTWQREESRFTEMRKMQINSNLRKCSSLNNRQSASLVGTLLFLLTLNLIHIFKCIKYDRRKHRRLK